MENIVKHELYFTCYQVMELGLFRKRKNDNDR